MMDFLQGVDMLYIIMGLGGFVVLEFILIIILLAKVGKLKKNYKTFLSGNDGKSLEKSIFEKFDQLELVKNEQEEIKREIRKVDEEYAKSFSKMEVYKYNAFREMGGDTSFVIALLDKNNNGTLINGMNSQKATYVYAKEVVNGESKVALSKEESETLKNCMNQ